MNPFVSYARALNPNFFFLKNLPLSYYTEIPKKWHLPFNKFWEKYAGKFWWSIWTSRYHLVNQFFMVLGQFNLTFLFSISYTCSGEEELRQEVRGVKFWFSLLRSCICYCALPPLCVSSWKPALFLSSDACLNLTFSFVVSTTMNALPFHSSQQPLNLRSVYSTSEVTDFGTINLV